MSAAPQILRDYQAKGMALLREAVRQLRAAARPQRVLMVAPTGAGKTTIAAEMIRGAVLRGGDVLFLAHRKELIEQCSARLDGAGIDHEIIMAGNKRVAPWSRVRVASVQTLAQRLDRLPKATLIIVDEAHHARAATYAAILDAYPGVPVIGLTATPWRLDGRGLGELFSDLVVVSTPRLLIEQGHLVPYGGFAYDAPDLSAVKKREGDYEKHGLELAMSERRIVGNVVEQWQLHCAGKRTVLFAVSVAHSQEMVARFTAAGVVAEHLDGSMNKTDREGVLARFRAGLTTVVCNVNVLTEGFDLPAIEVVVLARPTLSLGLYLQMVGRGMRPSEGKSSCRIHDHAGLIARHGLPDEDRDYALNFDPKKKKAKLAVVRTCRFCFAVFPGAPLRCPQCGEELDAGPGGRQALQEVHGDQVRAVSLEALRARQQERLDFEQWMSSRKRDVS